MQASFHQGANSSIELLLSAGCRWLFYDFQLCQGSIPSPVNAPPSRFSSMSMRSAGIITDVHQTPPTPANESVLAPAATAGLRSAGPSPKPTSCRSPRRSAHTVVPGV